MTPSLYRLVYYSRNRLTGSPQDIRAEIRSILEASRRNNPKVGVTGALMFNAGCFAQVLEGPQAGVENTFERIQRDIRHGEVSLLGFEPCRTRAFETWSMAFVGERSTDLTDYGGIGMETGFDPSRMSADALFTTLQRLVLEEEASAA